MHSHNSIQLYRCTFYPTKVVISLLLLVLAACGTIEQKDNSFKNTELIHQEKPAATEIAQEKPLTQESDKPPTQEKPPEPELFNTQISRTKIETAIKEDINKTQEQPREINATLYIDTTLNEADTNSLSIDTQRADERNLWLRIKEGFAFPTRYPLENHNNTQRVSYYLNRLQKSPHHFKGLANSARPYLYYIVNELEKHNIPLEIALLPIVESRYDPFAYSPSRAAGLWQFIPSTGKRFGLTQDWWQDERRDTIAATGAAIQYLLYLHKRFDNDWLLALAAYNAGQGNVSKAIRKNKKLGKPTDYWSLALPKETRHYVPQLLAWREFIREAEQDTLTAGYIANQAFFDVVDVGTQIDLAEAAKLANIDIDTLYQLNPTYSRWATDPQTPHHLLVPVNRKISFEQALETIPPSERVTWDRYTVRKGDVLGKIAQNHSISVAMITSTNNLKSNTIRTGQVLLIPSAKEKGEYYSKSVEQRLVKTQQRSSKKHNSKINHKVKAGETLWDIGKKYGVSANSIAGWNNMAPKDVLSINQTLLIWQKSLTQVAANDEKRKLFYRVKSGDSLSTIANRFNIAINDIKNWNSTARDKYIKPGQLLTLYVALTSR